MSLTWIECGAYDSELPSGYDTYHLFEADPALFETLPRGPKIFRHPTAVWIREAEVSFWKGPTPYAGTIVRGKQNVSYDEGISVPSIDFSSFVLALPKEEQLDVSMDIEGAEYSVIARLLFTGAISRVHSLVVEWHADRIPHLQGVHEKLLSSLEAHFPVCSQVKEKTKYERRAA